MKGRYAFLVVLVVLAIMTAGCVSSKNTESITETVETPQTDAPNTEKTTAESSKEDEIEEPPEILSSNSYMSFSTFYVVGEIQNNLPYNIEYVKVVATFYDENGDVLGSGFTFTDMDILSPNQKSPFEVSNYPHDFVPYSYKLQASYYTTSSEPYNGLEIKSHRPTDVYGNYGVVGEVENNGDQTVDYVKIVGTFYNDNDEVICKSFTFTDLDTLAPGDSSPFDLSTYPQEITPARYEVQVQA